MPYLFSRSLKIMQMEICYDRPTHTRTVGPQYFKLSCKNSSRYRTVFETHPKKPIRAPPLFLESYGRHERIILANPLECATSTLGFTISCSWMLRLGPASRWFLSLNQALAILVPMTQCEDHLFKHRQPLSFGSDTLLTGGLRNSWRQRGGF